MKLGVHCSIRNGYLSVLTETQELNCDCVQMFTHSPRVWKYKFPEDEVIEEFSFYRKKLKISPLIIHTPYLLNLATTDKIVLERAKNMFYKELIFAEKFNAEYLVFHPGVYSPDLTLNEGIKLLAKNIDICLAKFFNKYPLSKLKLLLETVCGKGRKIGKNFVELTEVITLSKFSVHIGVCIDSAHIFSAGYNIATIEGIEKMFSEIKSTLGIKKIKLLHINDSKSPCGSQIDRHQHIGEGYIGIDGFKYLLNHKYFVNLPGIIETPKETAFGKISSKDKENLSVLRRLLNSRGESE